MLIVPLIVLGWVISPGTMTGALNLSDAPCGIPSRGSRRYHARVLGGSPAKISDYPYAVSLKKNGKHFCGGTLVHNSYVVTAAHCVHAYPPYVWRVTVGDQNTTDPTDLGEQTYRVESVAIHPTYLWPKYHNDIALLKLSTPVKWSNLAQPMCLPDSSSEALERLGNNNAFLVGWGNGEEDGEHTEELKVASLPLLNNAECQEWFDKKNKKVSVRSGHICAGYKEGGIDGCQGDSGGGLVTLDSKGMELVGIMSAGIGCGREGLPGVYTRVSSYVDWIADQVRENGQGPKI